MTTLVIFQFHSLNSIECLFIPFPNFLEKFFYLNSTLDRTTVVFVAVYVFSPGYWRKQYIDLFPAIEYKD